MKQNDYDKSPTVRRSFKWWASLPEKIKSELRDKYPSNMSITGIYIKEVIVNY